MARSGRVVGIVAALAIASVSRAETKGSCARCGKPVKIKDAGSGFDLKWEGLCPDCRDPNKRRVEMARDLEQRIEKLRTEAGAWSRASDLSASEQQTAESLVRAIEDRVAELESRLDAARPGGPATAIDAARDLLQRIGKSNGADEPIAQALVDVPGRTAGGVRVTTQPIEAAALEWTEYAKPFVAALVAQDEAEPPAEDAPPETERKEVRLDLPPVPVARELEAWRKHAANAQACAAALFRSVEKADDAIAAGDAERTRANLDRAAYLATRGQKELRKAAEQRAEGLRALSAGFASFEKFAQKQGKSPEQVLSDWLAAVRKDGLPPGYVKELEAAGAEPARIAKHREWLEGVDPAEAAGTLRAFVVLVAPMYVAEPKAPAVPDEDDLWDVVAIAVLDAAAAEEAR